MFLEKHYIPKYGLSILSLCLCVFKHSIFCEMNDNVDIWLLVKGFTLIALGLNVLLSVLAIFWFYIFNLGENLKNSCFYCGRVTHTRLKGGAVHHLNYPIFFASVDLHEMKDLGWNLWPLFSINGGAWSYCSLDYDDHLKGWESDSPSLLHRLSTFVSSKSNNNLHLKLRNSERSYDRDQIQLITHLTYFGYCFNPISFYFVYQNQKNKPSIDKQNVDFIITEVSNTPWIEQHSYLLHECVENVEIKRNEVEMTFEALWNKEFHVSPFMEMDYKYKFNHSRLAENFWVKSQMLKRDTNDVWFTANFDLKRIPFTPLTLLYVLTFYPIQTRLIQVYIHYEAVKLWLKGVPTFNHPNSPVINFGLGITDTLLISVFGKISALVNAVSSIFTSSKERKLHKN